MQRPSGTAAVRLSLWMLLVASFAMALVQPVQAGTAEAPEIQDPAGDTGFPAGHDLFAMWIENAAEPNADGNLSLHFKVQVAEDFQHLPALFAFGTRYRVTFASDDPTMLPAGAVEAYVNMSPSCPSTSVVVTTAPNCTEESVSCRLGFAAAAGGSAPLASEVALTPSFDGSTTFGCLVPLGLLGTFGEGDSITNLVVEAQQVVRGPLSGAPPTGGDNVPVTVLETWDRAPDEGSGQPFVFGAGGGNVTDPNDTDGDGLNDTWEQTYFGNITAQNETGDPDGDGLTNGQEEALGTDPTNPDTDGDGVNDKDDPFPTDPTRGGTSTSSSSTTTSRSSSGTTTGGTTSGSTTTGGQAGGEGDDDDVESFGDAVEKLRADPGYLGLSGGGFLAVLVLCIIALAVRWSL